MSDGLITGPDGKKRCWWCGTDPLYMRYHDEEWGRPVRNDVRLFEKICLEGFQAGLSWLTILRKRENFRKAFEDFDFRKMARYGEADIQRLLSDEGIIRHRGKIEAAINNAGRMLELLEEYESFAQYLEGYRPAPESRPDKADYESIAALAKTPESTTLSKDLKKRGWKFVGPTTCYAFMQSEGLVNDHLEGCHIRDRIKP